MEELFLIGLTCLFLGSSVFLWYYPVYTIVAILATATLSWRAWKNYKRQIDYTEKKSQKLDRISRFPELSAIYVPEMEATLQKEIHSLKEQLIQKDQTEVIALVESMETMLKEKIFPRNEEVENTLEQYIYTNHALIEDELSHKKKMVSQETNPRLKSVLEKAILNLEEKRELLQSSKEELVWFYTQVKNILIQIENMKIKSNRLRDSSTLLVDIRKDLNEAFEGFEDANNLLSDLSKL